MTNYTLNESKMFADITDNMAIIINSETGVYYGMNSLGTEIYENLINGVPSEKISALLTSWGEESVTAYNEYLNFLIKNEILLPAPATDSDLNINESLAKESNYVPKVDEFLDAQELLLADPIHEVKEEEGWSPEKSSLNEDKEDVARREAKMGIIR